MTTTIVMATIVVAFIVIWTALGVYLFNEPVEPDEYQERLNMWNARRG